MSRERANRPFPESEIRLGQSLTPPDWDPSRVSAAPPGAGRPANNEPQVRRANEPSGAIPPTSRRQNVHTLGTQAPTMIRDRITRCLDSLDPLLNGLAVLGASNEGRHTYRFNRCLDSSLITAVLLTGLCLSSLNFGHWCSGELRSIDDMFVYAWGGPINAVLLCVVRLPLLWLLTAGLCAIALGMQSWMFRRVTELDDASFRCTRVHRLNAVITKQVPRTCCCPDNRECRITSPAQASLAPYCAREL